MTIQVDIRYNNPNIAMTLLHKIRLGINESDESLEMGKQGPCTRAQKNTLALSIF